MDKEEKESLDKFCALMQFIIGQYDEYKDSCKNSNHVDLEDFFVTCSEVALAVAMKTLTPQTIAKALMVYHQKYCSETIH